MALSTCWPRVPGLFAGSSKSFARNSGISKMARFSSAAVEATLFFLAASIAISRIVLVMHFLSDVLAGVVLGFALGCASVTAFASFGLL